VLVDRREELSWLEEHWRRDKAGLILVYGRRRIGKTRLVLEWMKGKRVLYFLADEAPEQELLRRLSKAMGEFFEDELLEEAPFRSWRQALLYLAREARREKVGLVIDEFQYAVKSGEGVLSVLQSVWDERLSSSRVVIVLMGSLVSFAEGVLSAKNPLYGRLTGSLRLGPLKPWDVACFAPGWAPEDHVALYGVFGGVPGYLAEIDPSLTLWENVERLVLRPGARFLEEGSMLLRLELRDIARYYAVLEAIAGGATSFGEIVSRSGVPPQALPKYLQTLVLMGLVSREQPLLPGGKARYVVADPFLRFWFRYIPRYRSAIEQGLVDKVSKAVSRDFGESTLPLAWEETARMMVVEMARRGRLPLTPTRVGSWWGRGEEIDIVALNEKTKEILFAECKWQSRVNAEKICKEFH